MPQGKTRPIYPCSRRLIPHWYYYRYSRRRRRLLLTRGTRMEVMTFGHVKGKSRFFGGELPETHHRLYSTYSKSCCSGNNLSWYGIWCEKFAVSLEKALSTERNGLSGREGNDEALACASPHHATSQMRAAIPCARFYYAYSGVLESLPFQSATCTVLLLGTGGTGATFSNNNVGKRGERMAFLLLLLTCQYEMLSFLHLGDEVFHVLEPCMFFRSLSLSLFHHNTVGRGGGREGGN